MELFNKALFLSQQKILNQFVLLFRKNVIEKSSMIWRVLPLVKINTRISETPCIHRDLYGNKLQLTIQFGNLTGIKFITWI
jgi:hypothetical protein